MTNASKERGMVVTITGRTTNDEAIAVIVSAIVIKVEAPIMIVMIWK